MKTDDGKKEILNPHGSTPIMDVPLTRSFGEEIKKRIGQHIETFLKSEEVTEIFVNIRNGNLEFFKKASKQLSRMEDEWIKVQGNESEAKDSNADLPFFLEIPLFVVAVVLTAIATVIAILLSPILLPIAFAIYSAEKKRELKLNLINSVYSTCLMSVRNQINNHLHASCGKSLKLLSEKMLNESLPKRIRHLEEIIKNLELSREEILQNMKSIKYIALKVDAMLKSASELEL